MKTSSAKSKGRRLCQEVRDKLLEVFPHLGADDIWVTPSGVTGEDLKLSPKAREVLPFAFECKNQEALNIWAAIEQAKTHVGATKRHPVVAFKRNRTDTHIVMTLELFMELLRDRKTDCAI